jgi:hypothetical protein
MTQVYGSSLAYEILREIGSGGYRAFRSVAAALFPSAVPAGLIGLVSFENQHQTAPEASTVEQREAINMLSNDPRCLVFYATTLIQVDESVAVSALARSLGESNPDALSSDAFTYYRSQVKRAKLASERVISMLRSGTPAQQWGLHADPAKERKFGGDVHLGLNGNLVGGRSLGGRRQFDA